MKNIFGIKTVIQSRSDGLIQDRMQILSDEFIFLYI